MMTPSEDHPRRTILFAESQPEWRLRFESLTLEFVDVSILHDFEETLKAISDPGRRYHVLVTNVNFNETGNDNLGFALARKIKELCLATQVIFLDRMGSVFQPQIAKVIFKELKSFEYIDKDMFNLPVFLEILNNAMDKAASEQRLILLSPEGNETDDFFAEIITPVTQAVGIQCEKAGHNLAYQTHERMDLVRLHIQSARITVADLRAQELNVYYETGLADALPGNLLLVAGAKQIHEKMSSLNRINIPDNRNWKRVVRSELEKQISAILNGGSEGASGTGSTAVQEDPILCLGLIPGDADSQDTYQQLILPVINNFNLNHFQVNNQGHQMSLPRIRNSIRMAHLVVFDFSTGDAFLAYCAGYAAGLRKSLVFITQDKSNVPVDFVEQGPVFISKQMQTDRDQAIKNIDTAIGETMKKVKVFINHAKEDNTLATSLFHELKKVSWIDPWLDVEKLIPGQDWKYEIQKAMEEADAVLICMSTNSVDKVGFVQAEIYKALELQLLRPPGKIFMIPVLLEKCEVPLALRKYQWEEITGPGDINRIISSLKTLR